MRPAVTLKRFPYTSLEARQAHANLALKLSSKLSWAALGTLSTATFLPADRFGWQLLISSLLGLGGIYLQKKGLHEIDVIGAQRRTSPNDP